MGEIQELIQRRIDALAGTGVQVAVYRDGVLIVDALAGMADSTSGRRVASGTPIFSFLHGQE